MARLGRRLADYFPVTPLGLFVCIGAYLALRWFAYQQMDLVWLIVGYAAIGMTAVAVVIVLLASLGLKLAFRFRRRTASEDRLFETGRERSTGFRLPMLFYVPLVQVSWTWERPAAAEVVSHKLRMRMREKVRLQDRGHFRGVRRRVVVQDAFGLARFALRDDEPGEWTVLPHVGRLGETPLLVSLSGGDERPHPMGVEDGDRVELRRYAPGDSARFIHWKVYGRTRKLMVRVPERALAPARRTIAYLVAGPDDDATAAAARVSMSSHLLGDEWVFSADGAGEDTDRADVALEMIVRSVEHRDRGGVGLEAFFRRAERAGPASAVIFVPPRPGPWLKRVVGAVRSRAARARFVVGTDGVRRGPERALWRKLLAIAPRRSGTPEAELDEVLATLAATRAEVILVDRKTGRRLGAQHRMRAKREKARRKEKAA